MLDPATITTSITNNPKPTKNASPSGVLIRSCTCATFCGSYPRPTICDKLSSIPCRTSVGRYTNVAIAITAENKNPNPPLAAPIFAPAPGAGTAPPRFRRYSNTANAPPIMKAGPKIAYGITNASSENTPASAAPGNAFDHSTPLRPGYGCNNVERSEKFERPTGGGTSEVGGGSGTAEGKGGDGRESDESAVRPLADDSSPIPTATRICGAPQCLQKGTPSSTIAPHL